MPYKIEEKDGKFCVVNTQSGNVHEPCHEAREDAERQVRMLHEMEKEED
jgi:hypothetical protein